MVYLSNIINSSIESQANYQISSLILWVWFNLWTPLAELTRFMRVLVFRQCYALGIGNTHCLRKHGRQSPFIPPLSNHSTPLSEGNPSDGDQAINAEQCSGCLRGEAVSASLGASAMFSSKKKTSTTSFLGLRVWSSSTWCVLEFIWYNKIDIRTCKSWRKWKIK